MKHTNLPWHIVIWPDQLEIQSKEQDVICKLPYLLPRRDFDAKFISRACNSHYELLKACKRAWHDMVFVCALDEGDDAEYTKQINITKELLANAIAKAEGKTE